MKEQISVTSEQTALIVDTMPSEFIVEEEEF